MPTLLLVRHGQTDWNAEHRWQGHADTLLNANGREQAALLAENLRHEPPIDAIYSSDLQRAHETASIIGQALGLPVQPDSRLREMNFGVMEGLTYREIVERYPDAYSQWEADRDLPPQDCERISDMSARLQSFQTDILQQATGERLLLVTHANVIRVLLCQGLGVPLNNFTRFKIHNAAITEIEFRAEVMRLMRLNHIMCA